MKRLSPLFLTIFFLIPVKGAFSDQDDIQSTIDLLVSGGTSILHIDNPSFGAKMVPVLGLGLAPYFSKGRLLSYGIELHLQYSMKSNYNDYFYYDSFFAFSFVPGVRVHIKRQETGNVSYRLGAGLGFSHSLSGFTQKNFFLTSLSGGLVFNNFFMDAILFNYTHNFLKAFQSYETFRLEVSFTLWEKEKKPVSRGKISI
jgi:hypothetical protein